ncbi:hypothetical protein [Legionella sp.]|uniref:hypothetical protein n=1 Tax=Legionella sp. TaxID=459 RepID=UPI003CA1E614
MKKFNSYSLMLIGMYILSFIVMEYGRSGWTEGLSSLPIIIFIVFWSEKITNYLKDRNNQPTHIIFYIDTFIINYSLILALVTSLVFQRSNVDARGWWPVAIIFGELFALLLGVVFALLALMLNKHHARYTNGFAIAIFVGYVIFSLLPWRFVYLGSMDGFMSYIILLFMFHLVICLYQKLKNQR